MTQDPSPSNHPPSSSLPAYPSEAAPQPSLREQRVAVTPPHNRPVVTYTLLVITIIIFLLQSAGEYIFGYDLVANLGMKVNELILNGQYWRFITPIFLHGSILHVGFNMYALYIFGPGLERYYGHWRFLLLFFLGGFAGNVFSFVFSSAPSLGSSTAIFGLLAAEGVFLYQNQKLFGGTARRALNNLILIAVVNLIIGLSPGIDNWGHMGGLLGGTIFAFFGGPVLMVEGLSPNLRIVDTRQTSDVIRATIFDILIFGALAIGSILFSF
ncbi:MAG: rhomboid family intramembrane serine protease [Anaerolineales bacterium]